MVGSSIGMPDIHSGYGFAVGNVAAFDMDDPASVVSPGGVGFDINCGVRLIRTGTASATIPTLLQDGSSSDMSKLFEGRSNLLMSEG